MRRAEDIIDLLLLVHDPPIVQAKGRPTDVQKEKELSTRREPSRFEVVDQILEKRRLQTQNLKSQSAASQKPRPQFRKPGIYPSAPKHNLPTQNKAENHARAARRLKIEKKRRAFAREKD